MHRRLSIIEISLLQVRHLMLHQRKPQALAPRPLGSLQNSRSNNNPKHVMDELFHVSNNFIFWVLSYPQECYNAYIKHLQSSMITFSMRMYPEPMDNLVVCPEMQPGNFWFIPSLQQGLGDKKANKQTKVQHH